MKQLTCTRDNVITPPLGAVAQQYSRRSGLRATILRNTLRRLQAVVGLPTLLRRLMPPASILDFVCYRFYLPSFRVATTSLLAPPFWVSLSSLLYVAAFFFFFTHIRARASCSHSSITNMQRLLRPPTDAFQDPNTRMRSSLPPQACLHSDGLLLLTRQRNRRTSSRGLLPHSLRHHHPLYMSATRPLPDNDKAIRRKGVL